MFDYYIGIDTGVHTGIAVWQPARKCFTLIQTMQLHAVLFYLKDLHATGKSINVLVEDARLATMGRKDITNMYRAQGAGSVKRDAKVLEDFLKDYSIPHQMLRPNRQLTKWDAKTFKTTTGYTGLTSSHARDAAMLVYGR